VEVRCYSLPDAGFQIQDTGYLKDGRGDLERGRYGRWNWGCGLRPVGAIGAYAPEGRWNKEKLGRGGDKVMGK
jgi:hypothetical protein